MEAKDIRSLKNSFSSQGNEIGEILSNKPPLIVRWGSFLFLLLSMLIVAMAWYIRYPDIVTVNARLNGRSSSLSSDTSCFAELWVLPNSIQKVKKGQKVMLKVQGYQVGQYGALIGKIVDIDSLPSSNGYRAILTLQSSLTTHYDKKLTCQDGLSAQADIIIGERSVLERVFADMCRRLWVHRFPAHVRR